MRTANLITTIERDGVLHAVLDNPPRNLLDEPLTRALTSVVAEFERSSARVLLLSSAVSGTFASGGLAEADGPPDPAAPYGLAEHHEELRMALTRLSTSRKPSIAALDGGALGLGLELAMACTWRCCTPSSTFGFPHARSGALPIAGGSQRLPRLIGASRALDLLITGRLIQGEEAMQIGLADRIFQGRIELEALRWAALIAAASGPAVELMIGCVEAAMDLPPNLGVSVERAALVALLDGELH